MLDLFNRREFIVFSTRDFASQLGLSLSAATKQLSRLAEKKLLKKITKGIWGNTSHPWFTPLACVPYLLGKEHGYVSFLTALHLHGLLSQIPPTIQIATTGHPRQLHSPVATFEFMQIKPELMQQGQAWSDASVPWLQANAEKALLDTLYLATRKGRRFASLPELELAKDTFDNQRFWQLLEVLPFPATARKAMADRAVALGITRKRGVKGIRA